MGVRERAGSFAEFMPEWSFERSLATRRSIGRGTEVKQRAGGRGGEWLTNCQLLLPVPKVPAHRLQIVQCHEPEFRLR